jgi:hypothetical protein
LARFLSAAGVIPKTTGKSLYLLNLKEVSATTSIGISLCKMTENYCCAGIIINKVWNYFENACNRAQKFLTLEGEGIKRGNRRKTMKIMVVGTVACLLITMRKTTTTMMMMMTKMTVRLTVVLVMVFVMLQC